MAEVSLHDALFVLGGKEIELQQARQQIDELLSQNHVLATTRPTEGLGDVMLMPNIEDDAFIFISPDGVAINEPREDGDDSLLKDHHEHQALITQQGVEPVTFELEIPDSVDEFLKLAAGKPPVEPFYRALYGPSAPSGPMKGKDVIAVKRAISRWNPTVFPWNNFDGHYNENLEKAMKKFQKKVSISPTGQYGRPTHQKLLATRNSKNTGWAFDDTALLLYESARKQEQVSPRLIIQQYALRAAANRYQIHYDQIRPMQNMNTVFVGPWFNITWDCSTFGTVCYKVAKLPDPNYGVNSSRQYDGWGYTGTLIQHGQSINSLAMKVGDLVFYGWDYYRNPTHVAVYIGDGRVVSHGSEPGPMVLPWNYRGVHSIRTYIT